MAIANTILLYVESWCFMFLSLDLFYFLTVSLVVLVAGFLVRIFIILHDCANGFFFRSCRANDIFDFITGVLTFTPFYQWHLEHINPIFETVEPITLLSSLKSLSFRLWGEQHRKLVGLRRDRNLRT